MSGSGKKKSGCLFWIILIILLALLGYFKGQEILGYFGIEFEFGIDGYSALYDNSLNIPAQVSTKKNNLYLRDGPSTKYKALDKLGIAVRTGQHCAEPVMAHYGITGMCRASLAMYNTREEVEALHRGVERAVRMLR